MSLYRQGTFMSFPVKGESNGHSPMSQQVAHAQQVDRFLKAHGERLNELRQAMKELNDRHDRHLNIMNIQGVQIAQLNDLTRWLRLVALLQGLTILTVTLYVAFH